MPRERLPVDDVLPLVLDAVARDGAVVLRAPTGAGKTTRVPPALLALDRKQGVIVLEPRRVAARAAARRIAAERGVQLGGEVGYQVRFERVASASTRLLVVTEGVLLRRLQDDPFLHGVGTVVFDEFHERSLEADLALALVQRIRREVRPDLRVVVMSATLAAETVAAFLGGAELIESEGRQHPVAIRHRSPGAGEPLEALVRRTVREALAERRGHVLVFLPGLREIRRCERELGTSGASLGAEVRALHGALDAAAQDATLESDAARRVILATNVAETSLTIPGVDTVIDTGLERVARQDPRSGLDRLETVRISRESADQRAGRAGREGPGLAVRLYSRVEDERLAARRAAAIQRVDLSGATLQLHAWGETDLASFPFFERPPDHALERAVSLLQALGALEDGRITVRGRRMAGLPLHPRLARLLVAAADVGHLPRLALAAAALAERWPFERLGPRDHPSHHADSDVLEAVVALEAYAGSGRLDAGAWRLRAGAARTTLRIRDQLLRLARDVAAPAGAVDADEAVLRAVFAAYADRLGRRRAPGDARGLLLGGRGVTIASSSVVQEPELFVAVDVDATRHDGRAEALVRVASGVERAWLPPDRILAEDAVLFDVERHAVVGVRETRFGDLVLDRVSLRAPRGPAVERCLAEAAASALEAALELEDESVAGLRARVAFLRTWCPELDLPPLDDGAVAALLPRLVHGCRSFDELRRVPLMDHLRGLFTWEQLQALDREAPERIEVPSGSRIRLRYDGDRPPVLAVRIQEVFGLRETPRVARGRVKVLMHLLAPNHRPQQITDDMPSFWANTYAGIRAELRRRYPRHAWPEDPGTATAERRPSPRRKRP